MGCVRSKQEIQAAHSTGTVQSARSESSINPPMTQNVLLIWLDDNIDESSDLCRNTVGHFRRAINNVETFIDGEECIQFLENIAHEKVCMIVSGSFGQEIVPRVHHQLQLDSIFIFCKNKKNHKGWAKSWPKIKGVYTKIAPLCRALEEAAEQCEQNTLFISTMTAAGQLTEGNKDRLDPSFMYTQIMKEIFLTINFEQQHIDQFIQYCRPVLTGNEKQLKYVDQLAEQYHQQTPIWWYTCDSFLYSMVNRALRVMDVDLIIKLGFFIRDLHRQIEQLHQEQFSDHGSNQLFTVYRRQKMTMEDFGKIVRNIGGLMSFNSFLISNKNRSSSLKLAQCAVDDAQTVGVLFVMTMNPARSNTPFASIDHLSYHRDRGKEVLFSMHSVFRILAVHWDKNARVFQVNLELTVATDRDLQDLTDVFRKKFRQHPNGWYNICEMLVDMHHFRIARRIYEHLLEEIPDEREKGNLYRHIGSIKADEGDDEGAITCIETALEILKKTLPLNHSRLAFSYTKIGLVYGRVSEYSKALESHENALRIYQTIRSPTHPDMAFTHNNIGLVYSAMKEFNKALSSYEKALAIYQQSLPSSQLDLAKSYSNIGAAYNSMGEYSQALVAYEEALAIRQEILPPTHPNLAVSYNSIGFLYSRMGDYSKALSCHEKALIVQQESLPSAHPHLGASYMGIGNAYYYMGDYSKALSFYRTQLEICQKSLSLIDPFLACAYMTMGETYHRMGDYSKALFFDEKAVEIQKQSVSSTDLNLALSYNNIGKVYYSTGDYLIALTHHEKALEIYQQAVSATHPDLAYPYYNIGLIHCSTGDYDKSLVFHEKALAIRRQRLSPSHPDLAKSYNGIGILYRHTSDYSEALLSHEDALAIQKQSLPLTHPDIAVTHYNMGLARKSMGDYTEAHCCLNRAVDIALISLEPEHPDLKKYQITLADIAEKLQ